MESNETGNTEITFSRLDQEEFFPKGTLPWPRAQIARMPHRWFKVLLVVLCFALLCGLIALGVLYVEKNNMADSLEARNRNLSASMFSLQQELAANGGCIWTRHLGRAYYFSSQRMNWMQSRDYCISKGATLVIIKSEQKQSFLLANIRETHWIGLSDLRTEGQWHWVDDTPISPTEIQFWHTRPNGEHEPDNWTGGGDPTGEDCAALGYSGGNLEEWFDASCTVQKRFVCEK
ncbi:CD209 antigen-like protein C isoform X1 [Anguilla anguilla]|uniref:CD209 antigen-like protein C isoform X1 n=1 Tax=Anguilla anguilla TaxID=7936 RepID=UPI0015B18616|nr:CD209 antigen-like protein C isoform X1 [Anguilla anguilla]